MMRRQDVVFISIIVLISLLTRLSVSKSLPNDDISTIRQRVLQLMIWPTGDNISETIENAIMYNKTLNSSCYWPDINYYDKGIHVWLTADHMYRIITMLQALTMNDSTIKNNEEILSSVHCALNVWLVNDWKHLYWWNNRIGIPLLSSTQLLLLGDNATDFEKEKIKEISYRADWWNGGEQTTGANLVWMIQVELYRSLATNNITGIEQGFEKMWDDVNVKPVGGQGIQYDWSYHFHGTLLLSGSYGAAWTRNIILFSLCSDQTPYELNKDKLLIIAKLLTKGDAWMIIGNQWDWQTIGRGIDGPSAGFNVPFTGNMIRMLMESISLIDIRTELNNLANRLDGQSNAPLLIGNKHFYTSDYVVHRRKNWIITIKMQSIRTMPVECFDEQNLKGEHLGQGVLNLYEMNTKDYYYIFPLLDWQAINGITVEHDIPLESCDGEPVGLIKKNFVGGVSDEQYGISMMDTATHNLTVQRSWHFYDDVIIAFATNLTLTTNNIAWTTLASRVVKKGNITIAFFNSTFINLSDGNYSFNYFQNKSFNIQWIYIQEENIAYLLQQQNQYSSLGVQLQTKIGQYNTIGPYNYTTKARTLTIWLDHGQGPCIRDYQYMLLPNISLESVPLVIKQYEEENVFSCISTNNSFHGSIWSSLKRASFILWENITTTFSCKSSLFEINIQLNNAGAYLFSETEDDFTITVSHPFQTNSTINILVDRIGYGQGCQLTSQTNTNITLNLPSLPELLGSSVNVTCKKSKSQLMISY